MVAGILALVFIAFLLIALTYWIYSVTYATRNSKIEVRVRELRPHALVFAGPAADQMLEFAEAMGCPLTTYSVTQKVIVSLTPGVIEVWGSDDLLEPGWVIFPNRNFVVGIGEANFSSDPRPTKALWIGDPNTLSNVVMRPSKMKDLVVAVSAILAQNQSEPLAGQIALPTPAWQVWTVNEELFEANRGNPQFPFSDLDTFGCQNVALWFGPRGGITPQGGLTFDFLATRAPEISAEDLNELEVSLEPGESLVSFSTSQVEVMAGTASIIREHMTTPDGRQEVRFVSIIRSATGAGYARVSFRSGYTNLGSELDAAFLAAISTVRIQ